MHRYLETILSQRVRRVEEAEAVLPAAELDRRLGPAAPPADPAPAVRSSRGFLIGEIKRASPSKGLIASEVDVAARARRYAQGGAGAVSVLAEPDFFQGSDEDVRTACAAVPLPVLYKDFVLSPYQLLAARAAGARWVLLIARVLEARLAAFVAESLRQGLEPLVEVHTERELEEASGSGARLVGINARDLDTFEVDLERVKSLAARCPSTCACIAESGIRTHRDLVELMAAGAHGFLIGETLMRTERPDELLHTYRVALGAEPARRSA